MCREIYVRIGGARSAFQHYEYAYIAPKAIRMRTKMSRAPRKVSGSGAREARCSTTSTRRSRQKRSACGPKCRVQEEKCPDRGRAKRVAALRVRVDRAKSGSHPDRITLLASNVAVTRVRKQSHQAHFSGENDWKLGKSGQKKIGTKIIGPKFAENPCRLCRKLQKACTRSRRPAQG